jgi:hypothetical protein
MKRLVSVVCTFSAGFLIFSAWAGFIEKEFKIEEYRGQVVQKLRTEHVVDIGGNILIEPDYKIVISTGKVLSVPFYIFQKLHKGEYTVLMKQNDRIVLSK